MLLFIFVETDKFGSFNAISYYQISKLKDKIKRNSWISHQNLWKITVSPHFVMDSHICYFNPRLLCLKSIYLVFALRKQAWYTRQIGQIMTDITISGQYRCPYCTIYTATNCRRRTVGSGEKPAANGRGEIVGTELSAIRL